MPVGPRLFVISVFLLLATSFLAGTGTLIWEFWEADWFTLATHDSHLFVFFPTLGLVALAAFYAPSSALVDLYWRHVPFGKPRFVSACLLLVASSYILAEILGANPYRPVWEIHPEILARDRAQPLNCGSPGPPCERASLLGAVRSLQSVSQSRLGVDEFIHDCSPEPLIEAGETARPKRFCFAQTPLTSPPRLSSTQECCLAQRRFEEAVVRTLSDPTHRSLTGEVHAWLLPFKVFFLLTLLAIGLALAFRHDAVVQHYPKLMRRIEIGVIAGAAAMLFFPLMSQAFVQTASALYGDSQGSGFKPIVPIMSFAFGAWALLILLFFYRRHNHEVELAGKFAGAIASGVAVVKYDLIVDLTVRFLGSGATVINISLLVLISILAIFFLRSRTARGPSQQDPAN
jgi:hypothetical protein